mgnify:CR=1 FL=1
MTSDAKTPNEYFENLPEERKEAMNELRRTILSNLPEGFEEAMGYGMVGYCVPHSIYPSGYHCDAKQPLPFIGLASQKNFIAFYHMGMYAMPQIMDWFVSEYSKFIKTKIDMGKSCVRLKKKEQIPFALIAELCKKITVQEWIEVYEKNLKR